MASPVKTRKRIVSFLLLFLLIPLSPDILNASNNPWIQNDWSGQGDTAAVARHPGDQTGWRKFYDQDANVVITSGGKVSLAAPPFSGFLVSSPFDSADPTNTLRRLQWTEETTSGISDLGLQIRTAPGPATLLTAPWYGRSHTALVGPYVPVQDAGFESCTANGAIPPGWQMNKVYASSGCFTQSRTPHSGTWMGGVYRGEYLYQAVSLSAGIPYTFSVWAKREGTQTGSQTATLLVSSAPGGGTSHCSWTTNSLNWVQISCAYTPPLDETVYVNLEAGLVQNWVLFDDASVSVPNTVGMAGIVVTDVSGFNAGDWVTLTDYSAAPPQEERKRIVSIDPANGAIILDSPLTYAYPAGSILTNTYTDPWGSEAIDFQQRYGTGNQWFQYRIYLATTDSLILPTFIENRIGYLPAAGFYQPDGALDTDGNGTYDNGDGIYGAIGSGGGGEAARSVNPAFRGGGQAAVYPLQIQNDGNAVGGVDTLDTYTLTWAAPPDDASGSWSAVLIDGNGNPLTSPAAVTLDAGGAEDYTLRVTPSLYAPADSVQPVILNLRSENEYAQVDSIRAVTTVSRIFQGDGILDGNGDGDGSGSGAGYDTAGNGNGGAASRNALPGETTAYSLTLENEGNIQDGYTLSQTSTCTDANQRVIGLPPKWRIFVNDGTADHDVTSSSLSWTTPVLPATVNAGAVSHADYTLKIYTEGEPVSCETVVKIVSTQNTPTDPSDDLPMDSVKAATALGGDYGVDLWIEGSHGDNVYGSAGTGSGGSYSQGIAGGSTGTFGFSVQNEGNIPDYFELSWNPPAGWTTAILKQDQDQNGNLQWTPLCAASPCTVPPSDLDCPYKSGSQCLAIPGEVIPLKLEVTPSATFTSGSTDIVVDGKSHGDPARVDSILARAWANALTLTVASVTSKSATLNWTAPSWSAKIYDLRYSTKQIIEEGLIPGPDQVNFSDATAVRGISAPKSWGSPESFTVSQLYADTAYYFALKTKVGASYTSVISLCANCPRRTAVSTDAIPPASAADLTVTAATADTLTLCWSAPGTQLFSDDFGDGTLSPWDQLQGGLVSMVDDPTDGWVLRKTTNGDPGGGWAPLNQSAGDFELVVSTKRLNLLGGTANRYSVTDANGNGYDIDLHFANQKLYLARRDAPWGTGSTVLGTAASVTGGLSTGEWYTLRLKRTGGSLTAEVFSGKGFSGGVPAASVTATDGTYGNFTQVNVNGGYDFDTDDVRISSLSGENATAYLLKYGTESLVDDGTAPGMGEVTFSQAAAAAGMGLPKTPGSQECYRVEVKNVLAGPDGASNTPDDIDRTPNTQFFFALKSEDENHNLSPLSNVASGLTALSSNAYNMVSVPKVPSPDDPVSVFGDDVGTPMYLYGWDSRGVGHDRGCYDGYDDPDNSKDGPYNPNNVVPNCVAISAVGTGTAYFLWSPRLDIAIDAPAGSTDAPTTACTDENGQTFTCYAFPLQEGWNMIGNPFGKEVDVSAIKVRQTDQQGQQTVVTTATFLQAVTAQNWMGNAIYTHNGTNYTYEVCDGTGCTPVLQSWKGYWIWLHKQGDGGGNTTYDLLIPKP